MTNTTRLEPLDSLYSVDGGAPLPLPDDLLRIYGPLSLPLAAHRSYVISNFVTSLDGKISLNMPGKMGGGEISGHNAQDRFVMGLLRALADVVLITSMSLRVARNHIWTGWAVYPELADSYAELRARMGLAPVPLHVVISGRGDLNTDHRVFTSGEVPSLVLTTRAGEARAEERKLPPAVPVVNLEPSGQLSAGEILAAVRQFSGERARLVLSEGGAHLLGTLLQGNRLDELFLTLAPQAVGNDETLNRPSLVAGHVLAPGAPRWSELVSLKRGGSFLFLRYRFAAVT